MYDDLFVSECNSSGRCPPFDRHPLRLRLVWNRRRVPAWSPGNAELEQGMSSSARASGLIEVLDPRRSLHRDVLAGKLKYKNITEAPLHPLLSTHNRTTARYQLYSTFFFLNPSSQCHPPSTPLRTERGVILEIWLRIPSGSGKTSKTDQGRLKPLGGSSATAANHHRTLTVPEEVRSLVAPNGGHHANILPVAPLALGLQVTAAVNRRRRPAERSSVNFWANGSKIVSSF